MYRVIGWGGEPGARGAYACLKACPSLPSRPQLDDRVALQAPGSRLHGGDSPPYFQNMGSHWQSRQ